MRGPAARLQHRLRHLFRGDFRHAVVVAQGALAFKAGAAGDLVLDDGVVLAVAGGIVSDPPTFDFLMRHFHTVWLRARPETHMQRVAEQGDVRPMAGNPQAMDELKSILTSREALYAEAEAMIDTEGKSEAESARELLAAVKALGLT